MKIKTYLPIFSGFYNTIWEFDYNYINEDILQQRQENGLYSDLNIEINIDNTSYENDIAGLLCDVIKEKLNDYINSIEFENVYNPKTYNFHNDSINVIINPNIENIKNFIYSNKEKFIKYLKNKYTSCDGFISHYSNCFENWENDTNNFTDLNINSHVLGSILDFIACILDIKEFDLYDDDVIENINVFEYIINYDDLINYTDNSLFEYFTKNGYSKKIASYYVNCYENNNIDKIIMNEKSLSIIKEFENNKIEV